ncbi:F0F1 ATP synthase subunit A [Candidatus Nomurabacteria bacterium]|nr:F0F1 ATP synthase subunit A [Candidatus Nomurabacteria bacterium]USN94969.1 MAG: F0F1 ATP synthase subunit A [Candidatus Nomurabacteria bacterium]
MLGIEREISPIGPETIFEISGFRVANSTLFIVFMIILMIVFYKTVMKKFKTKPTSIQVGVEMLYEGVIDLIDQITGNKERSKKVFAIVFSILVFVGISNLIGLIPGLTSITYDGLSIFRTPTADFNTTFVLAFGSVLVLQFVSIKEWGLWGHINKFVKISDLVKGFKGGIKSGMMALIDFFIGLLDIVGELAKVFSLSLRLFGNMYAGEVLMIIIVGSLAYVLPSVWLSMNLLVGVIQALVFGSLVTAYYMLSVKEDESQS